MPGMLKRHPQIVLRPEASLRQAMKVMTECESGLVMVTDARHRLLGVLADIDLRRVLLSGAELSSPARLAMNTKPVVVREGTPPEEVSELFRRTGHTNIPVVDAQNRLVELANVADYAAIPRRYPNRVVLMAGGQGRRLRPLTSNTPKPMLKLGDKPILEHLIEQLAAAGFVHFVIAVNYLADKIHGHFGDGSRWGVEIEYLRERKPLGTVGALALLDPAPKKPFLVMNGDVLTKADFGALLEFHAAEKGLATVCVKRHEIQIPYGVIELDGRRLSSFREKPTHRFLINAGIYVLDPRALVWLPKGRPCDMPELLAAIGRKRKNGVACFPVEEYWLDIGGLREFQRATSEFGEVFGR
jgi:dTDP-glucose pyrophosphorylase